MTIQGIRLFYPLIDEQDARSISVALDEAWLGLGKHVYEFEQLWEKRLCLEPGHAIATNSATAALHLSLLLADLPPASEVLVPSLTFISSVSTIVQAGHVPVFVDVDEQSLTVSVSDLARKITSKTKAIVVVHYGGEPCDMPAIIELAHEHKLIVIEDCAHTQGSTYKGRPLGSWGDFGCFSFEEKKGMTTGDGGMIVTKKRNDALRAKHMRWLGIDKDTWQRSSSNQGHHNCYYEIHELGYKYNMNNLAARLGISQLQKLDRINSIKRTHIQHYLERLSGIPAVKPLLPYSLLSDESCSYWLFGLRVENRDKLMTHLDETNISYGMHFTPINEQPIFHGSGHTPVTSRIAKQIITLPLSPGHSHEQIEYVCQEIIAFFS